MNKIYVFLTLTVFYLLTTLYSYAQNFIIGDVKEVWICSDPYVISKLQEHNILSLTLDNKFKQRIVDSSIMLTRDYGKLEESELGRVYIPGIPAEYSGIFRFEGLDRAWYFGEINDEGYYQYGFNITVGGNGYYFNFINAKEGENVTSSQNFKCFDRKN